MGEMRDTMLAYRRLFLSDTGAMTPDGEEVMRDIEKRCGWMTFTMPLDKDGRVDPFATAAAVERRGVYAHIRTRLFDRLPERKDSK